MNFISFSSLENGISNITKSINRFVFFFVIGVDHARIFIETFWRETATSILRRALTFVVHFHQSLGK